jgi:CCR4-NOT transcription complex subunit 6
MFASNCCFPAQFVLIKEQLVEFNQLAIEHANGHEDMLNRVMTKDNIALAALLHTREPCWENGIPPDPSQVKILCSD